MKQFGALIISVILFAACNNSSPKLTAKTDTVLVAYTPIGNDSGWAFAKGTYRIGKKWAYGDSANSEGNYKMDTVSWKFWLLVDTARDGNKKPIYDSTGKRWKMKSDWVELNEAQKQTIIISILPKAHRSGK